MLNFIIQRDIMDNTYYAFDVAWCIMFYKYDNALIPLIKWVNFRRTTPTLAYLGISKTRYNTRVRDLANFTELQKMRYLQYWRHLILLISEHLHKDHEKTWVLFQKKKDSKQTLIQKTTRNSLQQLQNVNETLKAKLFCFYIMKI